MSDCNLDNNTSYIISGILGGLFILSEILGVIDKVKANSIIHFIILLLKNNNNKKITIESIEETLIEQSNV
jgi:hypothetical protein